MRPVVAPRQFGDVAEREIGAGLEIAHDDVGAAAARRAVAPERDVEPSLLSEYDSNVIERRGRTRAQIDDADLVAVAGVARRPRPPAAATAAAAPRPVHRDRAVSGATV